jgi:hypothetical protein
MVPFLAFGILKVTGKYLANSFSEISDPVKSLSDGLFKVIDNTPDNPLLSIWYLLVLFIYTIIVPIFWRFGGRKIYLIILFGIIGSISGRVLFKTNRDISDFFWNWRSICHKKRYNIARIV